MINFNKSASFLKKVLTNKVVCAYTLLSITAIALTFVLSSIHCIEIVDGSNKTKVYSFSKSTATVLNIAGIELGKYDNAAYDNSGALIIERNFPVNLVVGNEEEVLYTSGGTVGELLEEEGITLGEHDVINFSLDHKLSSGMTIEFTEVEYVYTKKTEAVEYYHGIQYVSTMKKGTSVSRGGVDGEKEVTYFQKIVNGEVVESTVVGEVITKQPINKLTCIGTKTSPDGVSYPSDKWISHLRPDREIELDVNGKPVHYKQVFTGLASAYSPDDGRWSATGVVLEAGYVAVDPNVIPYGSKLYIKTADGSIIYGYAIAADTGGFVHMYPEVIVDLFLESEEEAKSFGRKSIEIYVLE